MEENRRRRKRGSARTAAERESGRRIVEVETAERNGVFGRENLGCGYVLCEGKGFERFLRPVRFRE